MHGVKVLLTLIAGVVVINVATTTPATTYGNQSGCHNSLILLNCVSYDPSLTGVSLKWMYKTTTGKWRKLASIRKGKTRPFSSGTQFHQRLFLHPNGSLEITALKTHDETDYQCKVSAIGRRGLHKINLTVACYGEVTRVTNKVCQGEEILLECLARYRTNPHYLQHTKWQQQTQVGSWERVATSRGRVRPSYNYLQNGSLLVPGRTNADKITFRCVVTKTKSWLATERHIVEIEYINCDNGKTTAATTNKLNGRAATQTTSPPIKGATFVCGESLTAATGGFQSPNFPSAYPANSHCRWTISVPRDYAAINITLEQMDLEYEDNCEHDYIAIYDNLGNQVDCRRCGVYNKPRKLQIGGRVAVIVFRTDGNAQKTGFKLTYKAAMLIGKATQ